MDARDRGATSRAKGDAREGARRRASDAFDGVENVRANGTGRGIGAGARARGGGRYDRGRRSGVWIKARGARGRSRSRRGGRGERRRRSGSGVEDSGAKMRRAATRRDEKTID